MCMVIAECNWWEWEHKWEEERKRKCDDDDNQAKNSIGRSEFFADLLSPKNEHDDARSGEESSESD